MSTTLPALETERWNGIPAPSPAFLVAFMSSTVAGSKATDDHPKPERYRQLLREALTIEEWMDYETLYEHFSLIGDRAKEMECRTCFGSGDILSAGKLIGTCPSCEGTGLK